MLLWMSMLEHALQACMVLIVGHAMDCLHHNCTGLALVCRRAASIFASALLSLQESADVAACRLSVDAELSNFSISDSEIEPPWPNTNGWTGQSCLLAHGVLHNLPHSALSDGRSRSPVGMHRTHYKQHAGEVAFRSCNQDPASVGRRTRKGLSKQRVERRATVPNRF